VIQVDIKLFTKADCPRCPLAKALCDKAAGEGYKVDVFDVDTVEGMAEGGFHEVMATPTIVLVDADEEELHSWRGEPPSYDELKTALSQ